jgi:hypothetical protein
MTQAPSSTAGSAAPGPSDKRAWPMPRRLAWVLALACTFAGGSLATASQPQEQRYTILRGGAEVGSHEVRREVTGGQTRVRSSTRIDVRLLGLELYRFRYDAQEVWDQAGLTRLEVRVDDDGKAFTLRGERQGKGFAWTSDAGPGQHPLPLFPTNHWDPKVLEQGQVLNTLTGGLNRVDIVRAGPETLDLPGGKVRVQRYRYTGDLSLDAWYDDRGQWLGMRFEGRDGSEIRYLCANCAAKASP